MLTALLGFLIFAESLPPLWWLGASLLVVGNVIIGRRDEDGGKSSGSTSGSEGKDGDVERGYDGLDSDGDYGDGKEMDGVDIVLLGDREEEESLDLEDYTKAEVDSDDPVRGPSFSYR